MVQCHYIYVLCGIKIIALANLNGMILKHIKILACTDRKYCIQLQVQCNSLYPGMAEFTHA